MNYQNTPQLQLAFDFVEYTGKHVFLTGKAGTGKTTFLQEVKNKTFKRMVVVAPTGVAAINAGGVTIHSFFQLPFGPIIPGFQSAENKSGGNSFGGDGGHRFSKQKINIIRSLDLLVIDEISMVRSDMLDGIDAVLRRHRRSNKPFGGVQLLMIGDLRQLSPVVKENEWALLQKHYNSPYFYNSKALMQTEYVGIELDRVFRQSDDRFIKLLNEVRGNRLTEQTIFELNKRYISGYQVEEGTIQLTTHNYKAREINGKKQDELGTKNQVFKAKITGNFPEYIYPTDAVLEMKTGAQVMFIKNDPSPLKNFYNGKIGIIVDMEEDLIRVQCPDEEDAIAVTPLEWNNIKYGLNDETKEITESIDGTFTQIPLKLAWAITIHKSQGLTFDKAVIDAEDAFAHGQVYVALSRCRSLDGLILSSPLRPEAIKHDKSVDNFSEKIENNQPDEKSLNQQKHLYQEDLLLGLFDFESLQIGLYTLMKINREHRNTLPASYTDSISNLTNTFKKELTEVGSAFKQQIKRLHTQNQQDEINTALQERIQKASLYFSEKLDNILIKVLKETEPDMDNRQTKKTITEQIDRIFEEATFKLECLEACKNGFEIKTYLNRRAKAMIPDQQKKKRTPVPAVINPKETTHPELYKKLRKWRESEAGGKNTYTVLPIKAIIEIANQAPVNLNKLGKIHGIGKRKLEQYGEQIINIVLETLPENERSSKIEEEEIEVKTTKARTYEVSFDLWKSGLSPEEIAKERGLVSSTVYGHLVRFVATGDIDIEKLVSLEKLKIIEELFTECGPISLSEARSILGEEYDFWELRYMKESMTFPEETDPEKASGDQNE